MSDCEHCFCLMFWVNEIKYKVCCVCLEQVDLITDEKPQEAGCDEDCVCRYHLDQEMELRNDEKKE